MSKSDRPRSSRIFRGSWFPRLPTFGNSGRNILDGAGWLTMNLSLTRNFVVREKFLNRANFNQPVTTVNTPNAGTIVGAAGARSMQVALRYSF